MAHGLYLDFNNVQYIILARVCMEDVARGI